MTMPGRRSTHSCVICGFSGANEKISLFSFPNNPELQNAWKTACNLPDAINVSTRSVRLCHKHFTEDDVQNQNNARKRLKRKRIPSLLLPAPNTAAENFHAGQYLQVPCTPKRKRHQLTTEQFSNQDNGLGNNSTPSFGVLHSEQSSSSNYCNMILEKTSSNPNKELASASSVCFNNSDSTPVKDVSPQNSAISGEYTYSKRKQFIMKNPRYLGDFRTPHVSTPRSARRYLHLSQDMIHKQNKEIKSLRQQLRRAKETIASLTELLISDGQSENLQETLPEAIKHVQLRSLRSSTSKINPSVRAFSLTLHFYSPKAYGYVRKVWKNLLPHPGTLRRWSLTVSGLPGYNKEVLETIKARHQNSGKASICNLVIDDMSIRRKIQVKNDRVYGFVDLGFNNDGDEGDVGGNELSEKAATGGKTPPTATHALVFMLVAINDNWKVPFAYFFIESLDRQKKAQLLRRALILLNDYSVNVHSMTFDGEASNYRMVEGLGACITYTHEESFKSYFKNPVTNEMIYVFADPCHMLKNVRNSIGRKPTKQQKQKGLDVHDWRDADGNIISFQYIRNLVGRQNEAGLKLANKLTFRHVNYFECPMSVRIAAQTFSRSTKSSLKYLQKKGYPEFKEVSATAKFVGVINNSFDLLNCRSLFSNEPQKHRIPLKKSNLPKLQKYADKYIAYLSGIQLNGNPVTTSTMRCGFVGLITCLKNIFPLAN